MPPPGAQDVQSSPLADQNRISSLTVGPTANFTAIGSLAFPQRARPRLQDMLRSNTLQLPARLKSLPALSV